MEQEAKEALILRLFRAYPGGENKISRETLNVYLKVVSFFNVPLIAEAVERFSDGRVERKSRAFVPSADELATEIRNVRYDQGKYGGMRRDAVKQIEDRDKDDDFAKLKTPATIALVKSMVKGFVDINDEKAKPKTAEEIAKEREKIRRHDEIFADQFIEANGVMISHSLLRTLGKEAP